MHYLRDSLHYLSNCWSNSQLIPVMGTVDLCMDPPASLFDSFWRNYAAGHIPVKENNIRESFDNIVADFGHNWSLSTDIENLVRNIKLPTVSKAIVGCDRLRSDRFKTTHQDCRWVQLWNAVAAIYGVLNARGRIQEFFILVRGNRD